MDKCNIRVHINRIQPEIQVARMVAAIMATTQKVTKILPLRGTQQLNWWGYGLEIHLHATNQDIEALPHESEVAVQG